MNLEPEIRAAIEQHHIFSAEVWRSFAIGLLAEVDRLRAAALGDGWIPVGERLPEDDTKMLVLAAHPGCAPFYSTARYFLDSDRWHTDGGDSYGGITHWRELPPPPPLPVAEVEG